MMFLILKKIEIRHNIFRAILLISKFVCVLRSC